MKENALASSDSVNYQSVNGKCTKESSMHSYIATCLEMRFQFNISQQSTSIAMELFVCNSLLQ